MKHLIASRQTNQEQGFTLLEISIVLLIAGILAAISAPSLLGWYRQTQLDNAVNDVRGVLQQAQREAIRRSESCQVDLNTIDGRVEVNSCVSARTLPDTVTVDVNRSLPIEYSFRGTTNDSYTITFSSDDIGQGEGRCLRISTPLGLIGEGDEGEC